MGCKSLRKLHFPDSLTQLSEHAFSNCTALQEVVFSPKLTKIPQYCFAGCTALEKIELPEALRELGRWAFNGGLGGTKEFFIPKHVEKIGENALTIRSLEKFTVDPENPYFHTRDGVLFQNSPRKLVRYPAAKAGAYTIPGDVERVAEGAFNGSSELTSLVLSDSIQGVSRDSFQNCPKLTEVFLPPMCRSFPLSTLGGCKELEKVTVMDPTADLQLGASKSKSFPKLVIYGAKYSPIH